MVAKYALGKNEPLILIGLAAAAEQVARDKPQLMPRAFSTSESKGAGNQRVSEC